MTKDEINRAIAEKVVGWKHLWGSCYWFDGTVKTTVHDEENAQGYFNPAERIDHAWMVVEKFAYYEIWKLGNGNYLVRLFTAPLSDGDWSWTKGEADTAPMAICLAALETMKGGE